MSNTVRRDLGPEGAPPESSLSASRALFGRYRVLARLGRGGMADVFVTAAEGAAGVRKLAVVKQLRADLTKDEDPEAQEAGERFRSMFLAEAQLSARLNHPNIVHTYEVGEEQGSLFIAMEYVEGQSLHALQSRLLRAGKGIPAAMAVRILCDVLSGLHYAHELTDITGEKLVIVHRDVSPQTVMLTYDGGVKLVDFGVAKASRSSAATEIGTIKGKVRYMAPEQVAGSTVDRRADVFAVGVLLWELLAGKRLSRGETDAQALLSLVQDDAPSLLVEAPAVDPGLAAVVMRALSRDASQRFQTALEMRTALEAFLAETKEQITSEQIGQLLRNTFAAEREKMAERVRSALAAPLVDDHIVVDWGGEHSIAESGSGKPASRSASRPVAKRVETTLPTLNESALGVIGAPLPFVPSEPPQSQKGNGKVWAIALLAAALGAAIVLLVVRERTPPQTTALAAMPSAAAPTGAPASEPAKPGPSLESATSAPSADAAPTATKTSSADKYAYGGKGSSKKAGDAKTDEAPRKEASTIPPASESGEKGFVTIDTMPWTRVSVNGRSLGTTPVVKAPMAAGTHTFVLENPDEKIRETVTVTVKAGETTAKRLAF